MTFLAWLFFIPRENSFFSSGQVLMSLLPGKSSEILGLFMHTPPQTLTCIYVGIATYIGTFLCVCLSLGNKTQTAWAGLSLIFAPC